MAMTITEKILAAHGGLRSVSPGDLMEVKVDLAFAHDFTAPLAIRVFEETGAPKVFNRNIIILFFNRIQDRQMLLHRLYYSTFDLCRGGHQNPFCISNVAEQLPELFVLAQSDDGLMEFDICFDKFFVTLGQMDSLE